LCCTQNPKEPVVYLDDAVFVLYKERTTNNDEQGKEKETETQQEEKEIEYTKEKEIESV
jgi:hypothetical protein